MDKVTDSGESQRDTPLTALNDEMAVEMKAIRRTFPGVVALDDVDFAVQSGEVHALLGQNGAGKSTLMKILCGDYSAAAGSIRIKGRTVVINNQRDAKRLGIGIVHQELSLLPNLSAVQNVMLGREHVNRVGILDEEANQKETTAILDLLGAGDVNAGVPVDQLTLAQRQLVEIAKALALKPDLLILDEPTASLAANETARLFEVLRRLASTGIGVVFISHRLREVIEVCDQATILRNGRVIETVAMQTTTERDLIDLILGPTANLTNADGSRAKAEPADSAMVHGSGLALDGLSISGSLHDVTLTVEKGRIYGLTGLLGAGQRKVARALFGLVDADDGVVLWNGREFPHRSPRAAIGRGIGFLAEDRRNEGLFKNLSVGENITLPSIHRFTSRLLRLISPSAADRAAQDLMLRLSIVSPSSSTPIQSLSGGNQQKALFARWILRGAGLLVLEEPTHGVDVGGKGEIHELLRHFARGGGSVLVVSTEVKELLRYCDRIGVMSGGTLVHEFDAHTASSTDIESVVQGGQR